MSDPDMVFRHKRLAIDFDGTLFEDCSDVERSNLERTALVPRPGAAGAMGWLKAQGFELLIFTCRPDYHRAYMEELLARHGIVHDYMLFYTKPRVDLYIDDKGYRFESWDATRAWITERLHQSGTLMVASQQPETEFERILRKQKLAALDLHAPACLLDVGCGDGDVFRDEARAGFTRDGVEPDAALRGRAEASGAYRRVHSDLSSVDASAYDAVLLLGVLEHVEDDAAFLDRFAHARVICCTVPNAGSFHRHLGMQLGVLGDLTELQGHDHAVGHRRYYTVQHFRRLIEAFADRHAFAITSFGTAGFKMLPNVDMIRFADRIEPLRRTAEELGLIGLDKPHGAEIFCKLTRATRSA